MKRPTPTVVPESDCQKRQKVPILANYQDILDALDHADLTTDQLSSLTKKIDSLYAVKANQLVQHFPTDLWNHIFQAANLKKIPLPTLLILRLVSQTWNKIICSFGKVNLQALRDPRSSGDPSQLFKIFPLRHLKLSKKWMPTKPEHFLMMTGLTNLEIQYCMHTGDTQELSSDLKEFAPLTNLKKLAIISNVVTSLGPLTSLECLEIEGYYEDEVTPISRAEVKKLPHLTRLVADDKGLFDSGYGIWKTLECAYEGHWKDGVYHGFGTEHSLVARYTGPWNQGQQEGFGICYFFDGAVEGELPWKMDSNRPGVEQYEGNWKDGKVCGQGKYVYADGERYEGQWEEDQLHGEGTHYYLDGSRDEGQWVRNDKRGFARHWFEDGGYCEGQWGDEGQHGQGIRVYPNGDRYEGNLEDGRPEGVGTIYYSNGDRFEGNWKEGRRKGHGIMYRANGERTEQKWDDPVIPREKTQ